MFNCHLFDKRLQSAQQNQKRERKAQQELYDHNKYNQKLREIFDRRIEKIIEHKKTVPLEPIKEFLLNETFYKERDGVKYKMDMKGAKTSAVLKRSFNGSKIAQIQESIEKNKFLVSEYTETKPIDFRPRNTKKEIQPGLRFSNELRFRRTRGDISIQDEANESGIVYTDVNKSVDIASLQLHQNTKPNENKIRISHIRRLSIGTKMSKCTVDAPSTAETVEKKPRTELDSAPIKSIWTRTVHLPRARIEVTKKRYYDINESGIDDEMLQGEDVSYEHIVVQNSVERMATLKQAKEVLRAAKIIR